MANIADCLIAVAKDTPQEEKEIVLALTKEFGYGGAEESFCDYKGLFDYTGFGGRWGFSHELVERLNRLNIKWQGAVVEGGNLVYSSEMGNTNFGIYIKQRAVRDEKGDFYVESDIEFPELIDEDGYYLKNLEDEGGENE